jgi:hypothetical protein
MSMFYTYIAAVSLLAVIITIRDKNAARKNAWRIKERTLFVISALGGSAAMFLTMLAGSSQDAPRQVHGRHTIDTVGTDFTERFRA